MKIKSLLIAFFAIVVTGCAPQMKTLDTRARTLEPEHKMLLMPLLADLKVSPVRITYVEKKAFEREVWNETNYKSIKNEQLEKYKKIAISNAAKVHDADVIVGAITTVELNDGKLQVTVSGYPANYRNFRNVTIEETEIIKATIMDVDSVEVKEEQKISTIFNFKGVK